MKLSTMMLVGVAYLWVTFGFALEMLRVQKVESECGHKEAYSTLLILAWPVAYPGAAIATIANKFTFRIPTPGLCDEVVVTETNFDYRY